MAINKIVFLLPLLALAAPVARAAEDTTNYRSKYGFNFNAISAPDAENKGWLVDIQYVRYLAGSYMYWGIEGSYGSPIPTGGSQLIAGGLLVGMENLLKWGALIGASVSIDAGQASVGGLIVGTNIIAVAKPQAYFGFNLGGGFRFAFTGGYQVVSNVPSFGGPIFGCRIDYKTETTVKSVDE